MRILFIGNSFTTRNQLPRLLVGIAAAADPPHRVEVETVWAGGASLRRHWNAGVAQKTLAASHWDCVVLQEQSTLPLKNPSRYHDNVRLFAAEAAARGVRIALYQTWSRQSAPQAQSSITRAVDEIARELGAQVIPVGAVWHAVLQRDPAIGLYADDGSHPTAVGLVPGGVRVLRAPVRAAAGRVRGRADGEDRARRARGAARGGVG